MYTGNGITTEFPLPAGTDGSAVYLVSPAGSAVRMKQGDAYAVGDGAVSFTIPPPAGWVVSFGEESPGLVMGQGSATLAGSGGARDVLVIYPDGSFKRLSRDPWELLAEVRGEVEDVRRFHAEAREAEKKVLAELSELAAVAAGELEGRLLGYGARAEDAIQAAAKGAAGALSEELAARLAEIRMEREAARHDVEEARKLGRELCEQLLSDSLKARTEAENALAGLCVEMKEFEENFCAAMDSFKKTTNATAESIAEARARIDEREKALADEEERVKGEMRAMLDEAARNIQSLFPAARRGYAGDFIRQRRKEGEAVV
jgi:hypothetical protein